jgi:glycosyltransferase involved in cell wall biosynthesis
LKLKLLFAVSETAAKTGDFRRHFIISQFADVLRKKGLDCKIIDDLDIYGNTKLNKKYLRWIAKPQKLENTINEFKPDIVFTERASHFSSLILKYKIPLIIFVRGENILPHYWSDINWKKQSLDESVTNRFETLAKQKIADKCFRDSFLILPICKYLKKIISNNCPNKTINVLYQGIDESDWFSQKGLELKHPCVGLLQGAEIWEKAKEMLILSNVIEKMPDVNFYWAGDGPYRDKILPALEKFDNFHWLGHLKYPDEVRQFFSEIDIYALVSGMDMSPHTLLEAGLMKKPILATDVGGISESCKDGETCFLIKKNNSDDWINKILTLLNNKAKMKEMGESGYNYVKENFAWDKIADDFISILESNLDLASDKKN